jgi:nucleotide-binding universal stress UspA family protein
MEAPLASGSLETVVCGLDDSDAAREVLKVAHALATRLRARLVLAHVTPSPHLPGVSAVPGALDELRRIELEEGEELLGELAGEESVSGAELRVAVGSPGGSLADVAAEEGAGLVVVGSRGRGALASAILGSVAAEVIRSSHCPVVVVPARPQPG